jgi:predicted DNA-binding mobile mystery protein A
MQKTNQAARARRSLDERFKTLPSTRAFTPPVRGWIRAIREALGMSSRQLAVRLGKHPTSIRDIESSEQKGTIQLSTLRQVAEKLNCTLVYALVPHDSLEATAEKRAHDVARKLLQSVSHTMRLEQQDVSKEALEKQLDLFAREISPRVLWDE